MKALVYCGEQSVRQVDVDAPVIASPDVSVRVLQAGICGTDIGAVRYGRPVLAPRMTLGHEFVGRREDTGQLVVGNPLLSCGVCRNCRDGRMHLCEKRVVIGVHRPGAFAETVAWPTSHLVDAGTATLAQAAMSDPIATALHAFHLADKPQGPVAVLGAGAIGLSMLFVLKSLGVQDVTVTDISRERLDLALAAGADRVDTAISGVFDVVYDTAGT
ncbi:MAG: hypothetical protein JWP52_2212 [Rhizobacter sp.]|nr:hypothetical protein [Rhizobacter sp.]